MNAICPIPAPNNNVRTDGHSRRAGRFLPGHSGNPSGRPKVVAHIQELARQHAPQALAALVEIATSGVSESARVAAACALLDRGYGKPVSATQIIPPTRDPRDMSNEELDEAIDALQRKICAQTEALESYSLAEADDEQRQQSLEIP
jgi:uncharacterized protein YciI